MPSKSVSRLPGGIGCRACALRGVAGVDGARPVGLPARCGPWEALDFSREGGLVAVTASLRPALWDEWKWCVFPARLLLRMFRRCRFSRRVSLPFKGESSAGGWCPAQSSSYCGGCGGLSAAWWFSAALQSMGVSGGDSERPSWTARCCSLASYREHSLLPCRRYTGVM